MLKKIFQPNLSKDVVFVRVAHIFPFSNCIVKMSMELDQSPHKNFDKDMCSDSKIYG